MKIVGAMVVGPGEAERYLKGTLIEFARLCDETMVVMNNVDEQTKAMIHRSGFDFYEDNREWGLEQNKIKNRLFRELERYKPDWVVSLDSDEVFDETVTRVDLERLASLTTTAWYFLVVNLWNSTQCHQPSLIFWNVRFWKYQAASGLQTDNKPLHCGLAPVWAYQYGNYAPHLLKHYGMMKKEDREKKVERYRKYDPDAVYKAKSYYDALASNDEGEVFNEQEWISKVQEEVKDYKVKEKVRMYMGKITGFVYVQREDGSVIDIPKHHVEITLKQHPLWKVLSEATQRVPIEEVPIIEETAPVVEEIVPELAEPLVSEEPTMEYICLSCPKKFTNERGLKIHRGREHKV